jgi:hypothetical protein
MKRLLEAIKEAGKFEAVRADVISDYVQKFDMKMGKNTTPSTAEGWVDGIGGISADEKQAIWNRLRSRYNWKDASAQPKFEARAGDQWKVPFANFCKELEALSKKYGVAVQSVGGVTFGKIKSIKYDPDYTSGDLDVDVAFEN